MAKTDYNHAPVKVIDAAIEGGQLSLTAAKNIMRARAQRNSVPGSNARRWLVAHGFTTRPPATPTPARVVTQATTPAKGKKGKTADPAKKAAWAVATTLCAQRGIDATGPAGGPTPEFWTVYREVRAAATNA